MERLFEEKRLSDGLHHQIQNSNDDRGLYTTRLQTRRQNLECIHSVTGMVWDVEERVMAFQGQIWIDAVTLYRWLDAARCIVTERPHSAPDWTFQG